MIKRNISRYYKYFSKKSFKYFHLIGIYRTHCFTTFKKDKEKEQFLQNVKVNKSNILLITSLTLNHKKFNRKRQFLQTLCLQKTCVGTFVFCSTILLVLKMDLCYRLTTKLFFSVADHIKLTRTAYISLLCALFLFIATDSICKKCSD